MRVKTWQQFKDLVSTKGARIQHVELDGRYDLIFNDGSVVVEFALAKDGGADVTDFETNFKADSNQRIDLLDGSGLPLTAAEKPSGDFSTMVSHNFCNNTTWSSPTDSAWELVPASGKILSADKAEVQFQHDVSISPTELYLEYHAWVAPATTMAVQTITFSSMYNIFELGNDHYHAPALPEITGGLSTVVFNYASKLKFYGSESLGRLYKLVIRTNNNDEITGTYATIGMVVSESDI